MDPQKQDQLKETLLKQRGELLDEMNRHGSGDETGRSEGLRDSEERSASLPELWVEGKIVADDRNLLDKIDLALKRVDEGSYGTCEACGGEIPVARLKAKPSVSLCVPCQEKKDAGEL